MSRSYLGSHVRETSWVQLMLSKSRYDKTYCLVMIDEELGGREWMKSNSILGLVILFIEMKNNEGRKN